MLTISKDLFVSTINSIKEIDKEACSVGTTLSTVGINADDFIENIWYKSLDVILNLLAANTGEAGVDLLEEWMYDGYSALDFDSPEEMYDILTGAEDDYNG